jgi:hypothetical protein
MWRGLIDTPASRKAKAASAKEKRPPASTIICSTAGL